ncbi:hypothetical protein C8Q70DRAFT_1030630 [Cubamyces menziesii]|nr:hypothetical protein C8Q70DRAFT_1030630 [Cubamyces menziesii]
MPATPARTPSSLSKSHSTSPPSSPSPKGVKRIVSGLKRRISHTFLRGHRHHASDSDAQAPLLSPRLSGSSTLPDRDVVSDDEAHQPLPPPIEISKAESHPIPIAISISGQTADTLTRSVAAGGLGKHPTDFSDSDATTSSDDSSSFNGGRRRGAHRTEGSDSSGSFSYTSPEEDCPAEQDAPITPPLPGIAEGEQSAEQLSPSALSPITEDADRSSIVALSARLPPTESLTAPIDTLVLTEDKATGPEEPETHNPSAIPSALVVLDDAPSVPHVDALDIPRDAVEDDRRSTGTFGLPSPGAAPISTDSLASPPEYVEHSRTRNLSFASIESLTAPLETLVLDEEEAFVSYPSHNSAPPTPPILPVADSETIERSRTISLASIESLTAPLETLVLFDESRDDVSSEIEPSHPRAPSPFSLPLPPSTPDSPLILPMDPLQSDAQQAQPALDDSANDELRTATLDSEPSESIGQPLISPPAPTPDVPDPFLREPEESSEEEESADSEGVVEAAPSPSAIPPVEEVNLAPVQPSTPSAPRSPSLNKSVPPTPVPVASDEEDEDEEDVPELYLPGLTLPTMFLPIPNTDPLSTLLTKYIPPEKRPPRDLTGDYSRAGGELHPLIMTNSWRAIARQARDRIVEADPEDVPYILSLWYLRLSALARMRLFNQTTAECTNLFSVLHAVAPPAARAYLLARVLPFELDVLHARLKYWAGDHVGYLDALAALLRRCRAQARAAAARGDQAGKAMWTERGARVVLIIASQLIEMRDYTAAAKLLEPLCTQPGPTTSPALRSAVARIYLQGGYVAQAAAHFAAVAADPTADPAQKAMNAALFAAAEGEWARAEAELARVREGDPENWVAVNDLAVVLLNQGRIREVRCRSAGAGALSLLVLCRGSPTYVGCRRSRCWKKPCTRPRRRSSRPSRSCSTSVSVVREKRQAACFQSPVLTNSIATLYELRSAAGADKKRELLVEVAKWAGDGLRTTCLKLPTT